MPRPYRLAPDDAPVLPDGWEWTTLGQAADTTRKRVRPQDRPDLSFIGMEHVEAHSMRLLGTTPASQMRSSAEGFAPGDVLYGRLRPYLNKVYAPDFEGLCSAEFIVFRQVPYLDHRYLQYFLNSWALVSFASHLDEGDRPRVNFTQLAPFPLPLPPLQEQHRIVAEIETHFTRMDAAVAALKRVRARLRRYKAAVLRAACKGRLVPTEAELARAEGRDYEPASVLLQRTIVERRAKWEAANPGKRYKEPEPPDTSELPEMPEGWAWATLPQMGLLARGKSKHRPRDDQRLFGGPYPFVQTGEVSRANGTMSGYSQTYSEFGLAQSRLWPKGTLCITIAANIAATALLGFDACFPDSVVGFIPEQGADARFIEYFVRTAKEELERYAPATAQKNINLETLAGLAVPLPPGPEQHRIVAEIERRLSVAQELEKQVELALHRAQRLRQAILKRAFEGRLVPQDPNDEPATVLLDRIRAARRGEASHATHPSNRPAATSGASPSPELGSGDASPLPDAGRMTA